MSKRKRNRKGRTGFGVRILKSKLKWVEIPIAALLIATLLVLSWPVGARIGLSDAFVSISLGTPAYANPGSTEILRPNATGAEENITYGGAGYHWNKVDEETPDDDATVVAEPGTTYLRDLYNLPAHSVGLGTINSIKIYFCISSNGPAGIVYAKPSQKSGTTVTDGTEQSVTGATFATKSQTYTTNPASGVAYTWDEIDALQVGLQLKTSSVPYFAMCTQVYVEIDYTAPAPAITNTQATWAIGHVQVNDVRYFSANNTQDDDYSLITNTGNCTVDVAIQGLDMEGGSYDWTLASAAGNKTYSLYANKQATPTVYDVQVKKSSYSDITATAGLGVGQTNAWSMKFTAPSILDAADDGAVKATTVTLVARAH